MKIFLLIGLFTSFCVSGALAQGYQGFFSVLPEIPIAPCYLEVPGSAVAFDTPGGRYIEVSADCRSGASSQEVTLKFYKETLPQLGWGFVQMSKQKMQFQKKNEILILVVGEEVGRINRYLSLSLQPAYEE